MLSGTWCDFWGGSGAGLCQWSLWDPSLPGYSMILSFCTQRGTRVHTCTAVCTHRATASHRAMNAQSCDLLQCVNARIALCTHAELCHRGVSCTQPCTHSRLQAQQRMKLRKRVAGTPKFKIHCLLF